MLNDASIRSILFAVAAPLALAIGCGTAPATPAKRGALESEAHATIVSMTARDPSLRGVIDRSYGYVVFPKIGKGGFMAGGAYGRGVVYQHGRMIGFAELNQASLGLQLGVQTFAELVVFPDAKSLQRLQADDFDIGANLSAVLITEGAGASGRLQRGPRIFYMPLGGLMAELSVSGQKLNYEPRG